jgi:hypothetical protein
MPALLRRNRLRLRAIAATAFSNATIYMPAYPKARPERLRHRSAKNQYAPSLTMLELAAAKTGHLTTT